MKPEDKLKIIILLYRFEYITESEYLFLTKKYSPMDIHYYKKITNLAILKGLRPLHLKKELSKDLELFFILAEDELYLNQWEIK